MLSNQPEPLALWLDAGIIKASDVGVMGWLMGKILLGGLNGGG